MPDPATGPSNPAQHRRLAFGALTLLLALLMLPNLIWLAYSHAPATWIAALVLPVALLVALFALLGRWLWLVPLLLAPFALLAPLEAFYVATYHTPSTAQVIAITLVTNPHEVRAYLGALLPLAIAAPLLGLVLALLASWWSFRARLQWQGRAHQRIGAVAMIIAIPLVALSISSTIIKQRPPTLANSTPSDPSSLNFVRPGYPFGVIMRIHRYLAEWSAMRADARSLANFRFHARRIGPQPHQRQVYVLVIGESSAREHWQLFGYRRATNPELSKLAHLVPIRRMVTSWPETIAAVPVMLTRKPITSNQPGWNEPSFLPAMQEAGYETWWISNQYPIGITDSPVAMYAYEAQHVIWLNHTSSVNESGAYDGDLVPALRKALQSSHRDMFIVLHMMGSHDDYDDRYPSAFRRFTPTFSDEHGHVIHEINIRNSYDNSILYTDHVLAQIIDVLKQGGLAAALLYESDHGEVLPSGTCRKIGHGIGTWHEFEIPALFWYSDAYATDFPERVAALRANADKRTLTGDTFESLIDMAGVTFPGHDPSWSLFSPQWHYRPRIVGQFWYTDFDNGVAEGGCGILKPAPPSSG
ncbi:MAG TPA: phosphoethanolamine transferase [Rhodanobacteraceae bacterium]|jgi:glucan phosphoethanolaminetransferase (alkaline phosphatase superfamily)|nr:phosphoethanolamine transferase [Rhodanobacteraceae bacterium]